MCVKEVGSPDLLVILVEWPRKVGRGPRKITASGPLRRIPGSFRWCRPYRGPWITKRSGDPGSYGEVWAVRLTRTGGVCRSGYTAPHTGVRGAVARMREATTAAGGQPAHRGMEPTGATGRFGRAAGLCVDSARRPLRAPADGAGAGDRCATAHPLPTTPRRMSLGLADI